MKNRALIGLSAACMSALVATAVGCGNAATEVYTPEPKEETAAEETQALADEEAEAEEATAADEAAAEKEETTDEDTSSTEATSSETTDDAEESETTESGTAEAAGSLTDGTYTGTGTGIGGKFNVDVTITDGKISAVEVGDNNETQGIGSNAIATLPDEMVGLSTTEEVDAVDNYSGASITSKAIKTAVDDALEQASAGAAEAEEPEATESDTTESEATESETSESGTTEASATGLTDGTYTGTGTGIGGKFNVDVTITDGKISAVEVGDNNETQGIGSNAIATLPDEMVGLSTAEEVDAVDNYSGASITSKAIKTAVDDALEQASAGAAEAEEPEATEPEAEEPEATEPEADESETTEPEATEPEAEEPEATEPESTEADASDEGLSTAEIMTGPGPVVSGSSSSDETTEPEADESETTEPEAEEPEATESDTSESETTEAAATGLTDGTYTGTGTGIGGKFNVDVTITDGKISAVEVGDNNETQGIGSNAIATLPDEMIGLSTDEEVDAVDNFSGASVTSKAIKTAVKDALEQASAGAAEEAEEPEATESESTEAEEPEATESETTEPEASEPETTESETTEPEAEEPEATESETTEAAAGSLTDGTYTGTGTGIGGKFNVDVTITDGKISAVEVGDNNETQGIGSNAIATLPDEMVGLSTAEEVDAVDNYSGASITSKAIKTAVDDALEQASAGAAEAEEPEATEPEAEEPEATESDTTESTESESTEPEATESESTEAESTEPEAEESEAEEDSTTISVTTGHGPVVAGSGSSDEADESETTEPEAEEPEATESDTSESETTEASATGLTDGTYTGTGTGIGGKFNVDVTITDGKISAVEVGDNNETQGIGSNAIATLPDEMIGLSTDEEVDAVDNFSGASVTSKAIKTAVKDALEQASAGAAEEAEEPEASEPESTEASATAATTPAATEPEATESETTEPEAEEPEAEEPEATESDTSESESTEASATGLTDGTYTGTGTGIGGKFNVDVTITDGKISAVEVGDNNETQGIGSNAIATLPDEMVGLSTDEEVDAVDNYSGASITSKAIKTAVKDALEQASAGEAEEAEEPAAEEPEATESDTTESTESESTEPEATEPAATESEAAEPEADESETTEPEASEPEAAEPEAAEAAAGSLTDGVYAGTGTGIGGKFTVAVVIQNGKIAGVQVGSNNETQGIGSNAIDTLPDEMVGLSTIEEVEAVDNYSGATITSKAIKAAVEDALEQASAGETEAEEPAAEEPETTEPESTEVSTTTATTPAATEPEAEEPEATEPESTEPEESTEASATGLTDGTYTGTGTGIGGKFNVDVTITDGVISAVEVGDNNETQGIGSNAIATLPDEMVGLSTAEEVDAVDNYSGASITSKAIKTAVDDALEQASAGAAEAEEAEDADAETTEASATGLADGTYTGTGTGIGGKFEVTVTITDGVISAVEVGDNNETQGIGSNAIATLPDEMVGLSTAEEVDAVDNYSGASITSKAIKTAVNDALDQASASEAQEEVGDDLLDVIEEAVEDVLEAVTGSGSSSSSTSASSTSTSK